MVESYVLREGKIAQALASAVFRFGRPLDAIFGPRHVAVIGATDRQGEQRPGDPDFHRTYRVAPFCRN
jgi:hypothetical protein